MKRGLLVGVLLLCAACGGSPTAPSVKTPNYAGAWHGNYTLSGCTQSGGVALANVCGNLGSTPPYTMTLTQNGTSVTGSFTLGSINFPNTGATIAADGSLGLQATTINQGITIVVTWALTLPNNVLAGTVTQNWTSDTLSGSASVVGTIATALR